MHGVAQGAKRIRHLCDSYRNKSARWTLPERRDAKLLEFIQFHAQRNINRIERLSRGRAAASGAFVAKIIELGNASLYARTWRKTLTREEGYVTSGCDVELFIGDRCFVDESFHSSRFHS